MNVKNFRSHSFSRITLGKPRKRGNPTTDQLRVFRESGTHIQRLSEWSRLFKCFHVNLSIGVAKEIDLVGYVTECVSGKAVVHEQDL